MNFFTQIINVIQDIVSIYFIFYIPISMLLLMIYFSFSTKLPTKDTFEALKDINEQLEKIRESNPAIAVLLENFIEILIDNKVLILLFLILIFLIPYLRVLLIVSIIKDYINSNKQ